MLLNNLTLIRKRNDLDKSFTSNFDGGSLDGEATGQAAIIERE